MIEIKIYPDGNKICAIIGDMPTETAIGFGDDAMGAIGALYDDLRSKRRCGMCLSDDLEYHATDKSCYSCRACGFQDFYPWYEGQEFES